MPWLRLWIDILDDADLHDLPRETRWGWTAFLAAAKRFDRDGVLPELKVLAHWVREPQVDVARWVDELVTAGMLDRNGVTVSIHGWQRWQAAADRTGAKRQAAWRARQKPPESAPLDPPEEREEKRRVEVTPLVTALRNAPTPDEIAILSRAAERWGASNGDAVVNDLLRDYPAAWVGKACDAAWDKHQAALSVPYLRGVLRGYQSQGGPPKAVQPKGGDVPYRAPAVVPGAREHIAGRIDPGPSIPAADFLAGIKAHAAKRATP